MQTLGLGQGIQGFSATAANSTSALNSGKQRNIGIADIGIAGIRWGFRVHCLTPSWAPASHGLSGSSQTLVLGLHAA